MGDALGEKERDSNRSCRRLAALRQDARESPTAGRGGEYDRIVSAVLFVLLYIHTLSDPRVKAGADQVVAERNYKLVYFITSLILVIAVLSTFSSIRILATMGLHGDSPLLDKLLTGVVLLGGTERLGAWMKADGTGGSTAVPEKPIKVTGSLTLDDKRQ